jgi:Domain of unknown function (DUF4279)
MKKPRPQAPADAPSGTVQLGGFIGWFSLSLHVTSDDLKPEVVSTLFGIGPTVSQSKGVPLLGADGKVKRVPKFGRWTLCIKCAETDEWDIEEVILALLARLPSDVSIWRDVARCGAPHLSVGLSLTASNESFSLEPTLLAFLGERGIGVSFDVYDKEF